MEGKTTFQLYTDIIKIINGSNEHGVEIEPMTNEEVGILFRWIVEYVNDLRPPVPKEVKYQVAFIKKQLDADLERYKEKCKKNSENIRKRWNTTEKECIQNDTNVYDRVPSDTNCTHTDTDTDTDTEDSKESNKNNRDINISCSKQASNDYDFEKFWKEYPRKIGKDKCLRWFKTHRPKPEIVNQMIEAVEQQKKSKQWSDPQYIPHPYTWLNQGRWEDELTPSKDSTFQSAPKNPIQWEEAKANTIEDDISLIKNNPDIAYKILDSIEKIHPERVEEIRRILGYWKK